jgi:AraC-like DNA-binding protein
MNGRSLVLAPVKEETLRGLINGNLKTQNTEEEATRMAALYSRVQSFMELRRPFLSDEFSLDDLAKNVFSNKTYLSRTINVMSGRNFCAFVNWYRVRYAQSLIRRNPHMRFSEMAAVCGFHSIPSFNMAFKANTGLTPSQWKQQEWGIDEP